MTDAPSRAPFIRLGPEAPASPVVLSVPHAGRAYSAALLTAARVHRSVLELLEDRFVDRLIWRAVQSGVTAFVALVPRAEIDLNRDEREVDASLIAPPLPADLLSTPRTRSGLGLIPSRLGGVGAIWKARIARAELDRRIAEVHRPYHHALAQALALARARFGAAILLDCHSMPPRAGHDGAGAIVLGDRHGATSAPAIMQTALATARGQGWRAQSNAPYAGGHIVARHGRPDRDVHAIQLEFCRSTYLDIGLSMPGPGFDRASALIAALVAALETQLLDGTCAIAAE